jgi:hypothetical protein
MYMVGEGKTELFEKRNVGKDLVLENWRWHEARRCYQRQISFKCFSMLSILQYRDNFKEQIKKA